MAGGIGRPSPASLLGASPSGGLQRTRTSAGKTKLKIRVKYNYSPVFWMLDFDFMFTLTTYPARLTWSSRFDGEQHGYISARPTQNNLDQYRNLCQSKLFFQQVSNSFYNYKTVYNKIF